MKTCNKCKIEKNLTDFSQDITKLDKLKTVCRACCSAQKKAKYNSIYVTEPVKSQNCSVCKIEKDSDAFHKHSKAETGLYHTCKECRKSRTKDYYNRNKEKIIEKTNKYYHENKNKESRRAARRSYQQRKMKEDPLYVMSRRLRNRLYYALKKKFWKKDTKFFKYIGCSLEELKTHIESLFKPGMTWDNRSEWHLDHIIPLVSAKTEEELYKLCHYTNIQPLWGADNLSKGTK